MRKGRRERREGRGWGGWRGWREKARVGKGVVCLGRPFGGALSAGPKSVAPVLEPETAMMHDMVRCSMNGRAMTMHTGIRTPEVTHLTTASYSCSDVRASLSLFNHSVKAFCASESAADLSLL